jgi:hypothetical protein
MVQPIQHTEVSRLSHNLFSAAGDVIREVEDDLQQIWAGSCLE